LFPNDYEDDVHLTAGKTRTIPGAVKEDYGVRATLSAGKEYLHVVASTRPWSVRAGEEHGPYVVYATAADRQQWQENVRGLTVTGGQGQAASELIVRFMVHPG